MVLDIFVAIKDTFRMLYMFVSPCSQLAELVRQEKKNKRFNKNSFNFDCHIAN